MARAEELLDELVSMRQGLSGALRPVDPPRAPNTQGPLHQRVQGALAGVSVDPGATAAAAPPQGDVLERLLKVIRAKESGGGVIGKANYNVVNPIGARGAYQFMPETWKGVAREAGLNANDWSPANQDAAARHLAGKYLAQYGDPGKVAAAWYGGPKAAADESRWDRGQGKYPTIRQYVDWVRKNLG